MLQFQPSKMKIFLTILTIFDLDQSHKKVNSSFVMELPFTAISCYHRLESGLMLFMDFRHKFILLILTFLPSPAYVLLSSSEPMVSFEIFSLKFFTKAISFNFWSKIH